MTTLARDLAPARGIRVRVPLGIAVGGGMVLVLLAASALAPALAPYDPSAQNLNAMLLPPSASHWFGTDNYGRDVFTRVLYGAAIDLRIGILAVIFPFVFGGIAGGVAVTSAAR